MLDKTTSKHGREIRTSEPFGFSNKAEAFFHAGLGKTFSCKARFGPTLAMRKVGKERAESSKFTDCSARIISYSSCYFGMEP